MHKRIKRGKRSQTVLFEIATGIERLELGRFGFRLFTGRRRDLERVALDDVRGAGPRAEQVGVGNDAEGLVVLDDAGLVVPLGRV